MQLHLNYKNTLIASTVIGATSSVLGVIASYQFGLAPGGTIVLISVAVLLILAISNLVVMKVRAKNLRSEGA